MQPRKFLVNKNKFDMFYDFCTIIFNKLPMKNIYIIVSIFTIFMISSCFSDKKDENITDEKQKIEKSTWSTSDENTEKQDASKGEKVFEDTEKNIKFSYPSTLTLQEKDDGDYFEIDLESKGVKNTITMYLINPSFVIAWSPWLNEEKYMMMFDDVKIMRSLDWIPKDENNSRWLWHWEVSYYKSEEDTEFEGSFPFFMIKSSQKEFSEAPEKVTNEETRTQLTPEDNRDFWISKESEEIVLNSIKSIIENRKKQ